MLVAFFFLIYIFLQRQFSCDNGAMVFLGRGRKPARFVPWDWLDTLLMFLTQKNSSEKELCFFILACPFRNRKYLQKKQRG